MRRTFWPCLALSAVLLAGCTGEPEPREPDPTGSTGPKPTATPPPLPEAATQETPDGAASFVDHYLEVLNYAAHTGDTDSLRALSGSECGSCEKYIDIVDTTYKSGGAYEEGDWSVADVQVSDQGTYWTVTGPVTTAGGRKRDDTNSKFQETSGSTTDMEFVLVRDTGSWRMYNFTEAPQ